MDVAFPQKLAITNAYGLTFHTTTHVASKVSFYVLQGKGQRPINCTATLYGKASVSSSSIQHILQSNSWGGCRMEIITMWRRTNKNRKDKTTYQALHQIRHQAKQLWWCRIIQIFLTIFKHPLEQGKILKYESYFMQTWMIFFVLCLAS